MRRFFNSNSNKFIIIIFLLITGILGYFITQLGLYLDDNVFIFPAVLRSFSSHFVQYNYDNGLFRPISLIFYYFIYSLYTMSPQIAHLLPFVFHLISGFLLIKIFKKQGINYYLSVPLTLFFLLLPFATEQYMFLAAGNIIFINIIFFIQVLIINGLYSEKETILLVLFFSLLSVFIYESAFFFFIPLSYLITAKFAYSYPIKKWFKKNVIFGAILFIPNVIYLILRIIFPSHISTPRLLIANVGDFLNNTCLMLNNIINLYFNPSIISNFWLSNIKNGLIIVSQNYFIIALLVLFIIFLIRFLIQTSKLTNQKMSNFVLIFWWLVFITSLPPLLTLKEFNFPFRAVFLPLGIFFIAVFISINRFINKEIVLRIVSLLTSCVVCSFLLIDISIASKYKKQSNEDMNLSKNIKMLLSKNNFTDQKQAYLLIKKFPYSSAYPNFVYADHIISCYHFWWCGQAALNMITGMVKEIGIQFIDDKFSSKVELPLDIFIKQRPLVIMNYLKNGNLEVKKILTN